jgi:hypothetical protein
MATIMTIFIRVISLLGKWNELTCEVFWWLVAGREHFMFFFSQKTRNERWEVVKGKQCGKAPLSDPASQDYGEQIPVAPPLSSTEGDIFGMYIA